MTLIKKARIERADIRARKTEHPEKQLVDLAIAWLEGEIRNVQLTEALGRKPTSTNGSIATIAGALRRAIVAGKIKITIKK